MPGQPVILCPKVTVLSMKGTKPTHTNVPEGGDRGFHPSAPLNIEQKGGYTMKELRAADTLDPTPDLACPVHTPTCLQECGINSCNLLDCTPKIV